MRIFAVGLLLTSLFRIRCQPWAARTLGTLLLALLWRIDTAAPVSQRVANSEGWRLETDKDGIRVYSRHAPGSRFKEIRVYCEMPGTLAQMAALYTDIDNYPQVISNTKRAYLIRRVSETEFYYYLECQMPRPATNRDLVTHLQFSYAPAEKLLVINTNAVGGLVPVQADIVRVPFWTGQWLVHQLPDHRLRIDYTFRVDPGGQLPTWLINLIAPTAPYSSFVKLRNSLQLPRYQNRVFAFLAPTPIQP